MTDSCLNEVGWGAAVERMADMSVPEPVSRTSLASAGMQVQHRQPPARRPQSRTIYRRIRNMQHRLADLPGMRA